MTRTPSALPSLLIAPVVATLTLSAAAVASPQSEADRVAGLKLYETKILPVLERECFKCHSADGKVKGGLRLDSQADILGGGSSGPALVPGKPRESLLIRALKYQDPDYEMPPSKPLAEATVKDFEEWIRLGAPMPSAGGNMMSDSMAPMGMAPAAGEVVTVADAPNIRTDGYVDWGKARSHWSFKPVLEYPVPGADEKGWCWGEIDRFLLADMTAAGLKPVADADKTTWLRRVTFDLTGLPPTPDAQDAFLKDRSTTAFEKVVDRLLGSDAFGERWGRHWLDVARYAESSGKETNIAYPFAWRYRDYVIDSFNEDKPCDEFFREQLAGDLLPAATPQERAEHLIATGFLAIGSKGHNTRGRSQFTADVIDEQIDAMGQSMLGLTIACARCHDHKFDPIPQSDYYRVAGIFLSTKTLYGTAPSPGNNFPADLAELPKGTVPIGAPITPERIRFAERAREEVEGRITRLQEQAEKSGSEVDRGQIRNLRQALTALDEATARYDENGAPNDGNFVCMAVEEGPGRNAPVLQRGEVDKPGETVIRGFPQLFEGDWVPTIERGSGRLELAEWVTSPENPLTARVAANRIWSHLFGKGIVPTPDNFGMSGLPPTHPELLDYLADRFVELGWSTKSIIREIALSHAYRLSSKTDPKGMREDPDANHYWRMPQRRLEGEAIRDSMLAASGTLLGSAPPGSQIQSFEGVVRDGGRSDLLLNESTPVRSVYLPILRDKIPEMLDAFDFCDPALPCGDRSETTVASQALYLMNDESAIRTAAAFADRLDRSGEKDNDKIDLAFKLALGREPTASERSASRRFFDEFAAAEQRSGFSADPLRDRAWTAFCQSLFMTAEFRTLD